MAYKLSDEQLMRLDFLRMNMIQGEAAEVTLARAKAYHDYVMGTPDEESEADHQRELPLTQPSPVVDPGVKKRRNKSEIVEATAPRGKATATEPLLNPAIAEGIAAENGAKNAAEQPKAEDAQEIPYTAVQTAVVNVIKGSDGGKDIVVSTLKEFGVGTALDLKAEQYSGFLIALADKVK